MSSALLHPAGQPLHHWLLGGASSVAVVHSGISELDCGFARLLTNLTDLDLSENELKDGFLELEQCPVTFPRLDCLRLNGNRLRSFQHLCLLLKGTPALQDLHASQNNFSQPPSGCSLGDRSFRVLNLSHTELVQMTPYLPRSVVVLDLSGNNLQHFESLPRGLRKLHLSDNHLLTLPVLTNAPLLRVLEVDGNQLTGLWDESGPGTDPLRVLEELVAFRAGRNPYNCSCGVRDTVDHFRRQSGIMKDWPDDYVCHTPLSLKGTLLKDLWLSYYECNHTAAVCLISLSVLAVVVLIAVLIGCVFYRSAFRRP
ncbi:toll-like receptor 2 [Megalops cyprinoides]|uniref:toll-like receptor 2 n=1 Tax=Megalops cyprinoides TaxID=118141 RepID=UPI0018654B7F|nr:toll-like receptor 2 [Megalops cyprinoides]